MHRLSSGLAIIVVALAALLPFPERAARFAGSLPARAQTVGEVEAAIRRDTSARVFDVLKAHFPEEYRAMVAKMVELARVDARPETVATIGLQMSQAIIQSKLAFLMIARIDLVDGLLRHQGRVMRVIASGPAVACAAYLSNQMAELDRHITDDARREMSRMGELRLEAIVDGRARAGTPPPMPPADPAAFRALINAAGVTTAELRAIESRAGDPVTRCRNWGKLFEGALKLPEPQRRLMLIELLSS